MDERTERVDAPAVVGAGVFCHAHRHTHPAAIAEGVGARDNLNAIDLSHITHWGTKPDENWRAECTKGTQVMQGRGVVVSSSSFIYFEKDTLLFLRECVRMARSL